MLHGVQEGEVDNRQGELLRQINMSRWRDLHALYTLSLTDISSRTKLLGKRLNNYVLFTNGIRCFEFYMA
jgi:hypothetical protein